jgi:hypothetical protein
VNKEIAKVSRPVGCPPPLDLAAISEEEAEERREIIERLNDLTKKALKGNRKVVPEIRQILERNPELAWRLANLANAAERLLIGKVTEEKDLATEEILEHQLDLMRQEVAGENASPLERLLAERVVVTWLQVQLFEALYFRDLHNLTLHQANYYQKRIDRAHRNHLSAIRTLAQIRKLGPALQINIGEKQINTAS